MRHLLALAWVAGCSDSGPASVTGGQSGTEGAVGCEETGRVAVADPALPIGDLSFAVDDAVDALRGSWVGVFAPPADGQSDFSLALTLERDAAVWVSRDSTVTGPCPSTYELPGLAEIALGTALSAGVPVLVSASAPDEASAWGDVAADEVDGTLVPGFDPADWSEIALGLFASFAGGEGSASLTWNAEGSAPPPTATATATVAGATEPIGSAALVRP